MNIQVLGPAYLGKARIGEGRKNPSAWEGVLCLTCCLCLFPAANLLGNLARLYDLLEDNGSVSQMIHGD